jgi:hypothetical protein
MQTRLITLGDPVDAPTIQKILSSLSTPGILDGMELTAPASNSVGVTPGAALTDSGVMIVEDEIRTLPFNLTVAPSNFTIYYQYQPSTVFGGSPASLQMEAGLLTQEGFSGGVLLGWIRYPGGSVPLNAASHFTSAARMKLRPEIETRAVFTQFAPFSTRWAFKSISGPTPVVQDAWNGSLNTILTNISNTGISLSSSVLVFPFQVPEFGFRKVVFEASVDAGASLIVTVLDRLGGTVTPVESNLFTNAPMASRTLTIPFAAELQPGSQAFLQLACSIQPSNFIRVKSLGISSDGSP